MMVAKNKYLLTYFTFKMVYHDFVLFREIGRMDPKELSRDTSGTRAFANFLVELGKCVPAVMLPSISVLLVLLDEEVGHTNAGVVDL